MALAKGFSIALGSAKLRACCAQAGRDVRDIIATIVLDIMF